MAGDLTAHHRGATPNQVGDTHLGQARIHPRHDRRTILDSKHPTTPHDQPPNSITTTRKLLTPYDTAPCYFTKGSGSIGTFSFLVTDIAPEEARGDSLEDVLVIYRHFCDILTSRYGKPKQRRNKEGYYRSTYVTSRGVGISIGGNRSLIDCYVKSPEEMFIASEYARLVAKGYISEDE